MSSSLSMANRQVHERFIQLSTRERALILCSGILLVLFVGYLGFVEPLLINISKVQQTEKRQSLESLNLSAQISALEEQAKQDPNELINQKLQRFVEIDQGLEQKLAQLTHDLVPATLMPQLLEKILVKSNKLKLIELRSIAPQQMIGADKGETMQSKLYQHGVVLKLEGRYFDIQRYIAEIETLPWHFYWKKFDYTVTQYPLAQVELELYTLSTNHAFIGV
jgi:MSHA biogenesis protein MshJ